jgi:NitT/TauT family transport system substrate-binding protein
MKSKSLRLLFSLCLMLVVLPSITAYAQDPIKLKIGYSVWVGYGPLFIAAEKGYFTEQGLEVELVKVEDPKDRFVALAGSQLDGVVTTLDTLSQYYNAETPFKTIFGLDESSGGDGIVVNGDIATVADLKGKKIGVNVGSVSQFFLEYVLNQNGLTSADVTLVKMKQGDVPAALASNSVDAGVTWEPHLSASVANGSKLLVSSKETPGLIVDIMVVRGDVLSNNPTVGSALYAAWNQAVDYWKANEDDANEIMAKGLGGFYSSGADIKADLAGATLFDAEKNAAFFNGTDEGTATSTLKFAIDFYTEVGIITSEVTPEDLIDASYVGVPATEATPEATPAS